jgi:regulator of sigma D
MTISMRLLKSRRENPITTIKITNNKRCEQIHQKVSGVHLFLDRSCNSLRSLLIAFFNIVGFVSSKSFQQYRHRNFGALYIKLVFFIFFYDFDIILLKINKSSNKK